MRKLVEAIGPYLVLITVMGFFLALLPLGIKPAILITSLTFIITFIILILVTKLRGRLYKYQILPSGDSLREFRTPLECDFEQICQLDIGAFPPKDIVPIETVRNCYRKNPKAFTVLCVGEKILGYYSVTPLDETILKRFVNGEINESDFKPEHILDENGAKCIKEILFCSMVATKESKYSQVGHQLLTHAITRFQDKRDYPLLQTIYATAATEDGRKILERLRFLKIANGKNRKDGNDLYKYCYETSEKTMECNKR